MFAEAPRFAAALSQHPHAAAATGEVVGHLLETLGAAPDLAIVFITTPHAESAAEIANTIRSTLRPGCLLGCTAISVVANGTELEQGPGISLWAGRIGRVQPVRLYAQHVDDELAILGWPRDASPDAVFVLLADPFTFPVDAFMAAVNSERRVRFVTGGLASAARGAGGDRLLLDGDAHWHGAVGVLLDPACDVRPLVSQGCQPLGNPYVVTAADGNQLIELGSRPALGRLDDLLGALDPDTRQSFLRGPQIGVVIDESKLQYGAGDFLIRPVLGGDRGVGSVTVGEHLTVGMTTQFHARDEGTAHNELERLVSAAVAEKSIASALLFTCNGRGREFFGAPNHDAGLIHDLTGAPVCGMFCAGELGPIGSRSYLHSFTASALLFR